MPQHKTLIWAHRGASGYAPENTMEAFILAHQYGADGIELDVQMSADGELVITFDKYEIGPGVMGSPEFTVSTGTAAAD